jgi:hypothetical protein
MLLALSLLGCATTAKVTEKQTSYVFTDISEGLPTDGLWRENTALFDMDSDKSLDIIAPPLRKGETGRNRPFIFTRGEDGKWKEGNFTFPQGKGYGYGGVGAGDLNGDGYADIVLAIHSVAGNLITFVNSKEGAFAQSAIPVEKDFHSRAVKIADVNGDGRPDVVAFSEASFGAKAKPRGILVAINKDAEGWDVHAVEKSLGMFGDFLSVGDFNGDGKKDIAIAPLTTVKESKKTIWFGDGQGSFDSYAGETIGDTLSISVKAGDVDGDGRDEAVFRVLSQTGRDAMTKLAVFQWTGSEFHEVSSGLEKIVKPFVFDLADIDGNGRKDLIVLSEDGLHLLEYGNSVWGEVGYLPLSSEDTRGAFDLTAARDGDGSCLIAVNLGNEEPTFHHGIKAYRVTRLK